MQILAQQIAASPSDLDRDDVAYVHIRGADGYVLSLARSPDSDLVEVMVRDQLNCKTTQVFARLTGRRLQVSVPEALASQLDGHSAYEVVLSQLGDDFSELHQALSEVFSGVGTYEHSL
ncbi:hypothetical protein C1O66_18025 [Paucibacter aquatile]|uniref:Uncharacterized protein n=1 Tax=Kinneretia aquatilis TaxID=2070761 RepID=A0A2N8L0K8_9BURK|nr:hypothetical protein [Paucibacter aquatile]PND39237.1 hypothetical protein C1O66_18025 [Paucibacter aquatile]